MGRLVERRLIEAVHGSQRTVRQDNLAVEEPLEIRLNGEPFAVTMRTPGSDFELAAGFLLTEGVVVESQQIKAIRYCAGRNSDGENTYNVVDVAVADPNQDALDRARRGTFVSSSCGVCGKASLAAVTTTTRYAPQADPIRFDVEVLRALPSGLRASQKIFDTTGGLHAAGLFDEHGEPLVVREDVGRHNAVDKVVGWSVQNDRLPLRGTALCVSGRASFELVQKASMAGIPVLVAVSAPSSLAVALGERVGLTIVGFVRGDSMNIYTRPDRAMTGNEDGQVEEENVLKETVVRSGGEYQ